MWLVLQDEIFLLVRTFKPVFVSGRILMKSYWRINRIFVVGPWSRKLHVYFYSVLDWKYKQTTIFLTFRALYQSHFLLNIHLSLNFASLTIDQYMLQARLLIIKGIRAGNWGFPLRLKSLPTQTTSLDLFSSLFNTALSHQNTNYKVYRTSSSCYRIVGLDYQCFTWNSVELFATFKMGNNFDLRRPLA